jgi:Bacterial membrane protein YfhO
MTTESTGPDRMLSRSVSSATRTRRAPAPARRALSAAGRRPTLAAAALYLLLALVFVAPSLLPGRSLSASDYLWSGAPWTAAKPAGVTGLGSNYEQADAVLQFQPFLQFARAHLPDVPLWNPHQMGGRPFVANSQSALFSPFSWPALVLPFWWSLGIVGALKLFCAALGAHLLARALGIGVAGRLLAGLVYGFGLYYVVWLSWPLSSVWAWLPWLLLCVHRVVHRPGAPPVAALALVVGLQFLGGHPESSFHVLAAGSFFALLALSRAAAGTRVRAAGRLVAGLGAGSALAAVALLPFVELLLRSGDLDNREGRTGGHLPLGALVTYALPDYWGRPTGPQTEGFATVRAFYAGALPLMLAAWALVGVRSRERLAIAAGGAVAIAVVVGVPGIFALVTAVPGFNHAYNQRLIVVGLLALALLAGWGLDDLAAGVRRPRLLVAGALLVLAVPVVYVAARVDAGGGAIGDALAVAWAFATPSRERLGDVLPLASLSVWLVVAGAAAGLLWLRASGRVAAGAFAGLALALVAADLFRAGMGQNPAIPVEHARQPVTPAIERLLAARPGRFAGLAPRVGLQALVPNLAMRYGLYDARGYDFPVERRYDRLWRAQVGRTADTFTPPTMLVATTEPSLRVLGLLGVTDILQPPREPVLPGLEMTYEGPDARLYANPFALPRAWVVAGQRAVAGDAAQLAAIADPAFDARRVAIVGAPLPGLADGPAAAGGDAEIVAYGPDRVELRARSPGRGLVVLSDVHFPGWRATLDGRDAPIERVDYLLRGVAVGPGAHRIVMEYRPWSWRAGWIVSLLSALGLLVMWKGGRRWPGRSSAR